jgi:hypothetical protein
MPRRKQEREPIPESFATIEEAAEWWDNHSVADYWDQTHEVEFEVSLQSRRHLVPLEHTLAKRLREFATAQGLTVETLVNLWLQEKLAEAAPA